LARVLIVGCGCRGCELAGALVAEGHAVRGTTRREDGRAAIEASGAEPAPADPDRLSTLVPHLDGVSVLCWLMGSASGTPEAVAALHGPRLESLVETLVDTPVRGVVYEAAGSVEPGLLDAGSAIVRRAEKTYRMPGQVVAEDPARGAWLEAMRAAVGRVLSG
jgi:nucleoside-diphosphate-sugar epimerase